MKIVKTIKKYLDSSLKGVSQLKRPLSTRELHFKLVLFNLGIFIFLFLHLNEIHIPCHFQ